MRDPRIDQVADAIEQHFPGTLVVITRNPSPDDPDIDWLLDVLNLPLERHRELTRFSVELGTKLFGEGQLPYLEGGVSPEWAAKDWAEYLNGAPARP